MYSEPKSWSKFMVQLFYLYRLDKLQLHINQSWDNNERKLFDHTDHRGSENGTIKYSFRYWGKISHSP